MFPRLKKFVENILGKIDITITRKSTFEKHIHNSKKYINENAAHDLEFLFLIDKKYRNQCLDLFSLSKSQLRQDLFVLSELNFKASGFFVEFGATNGINISNTFLLEKEFGWNGILSEPAKVWHESLHKNRKAKIEKRCIWDESNKSILFHEAHESEYSSSENYINSDYHGNKRTHATKYNVETISLLDLLKKYSAPKLIDYLSIDTEGSEFKILKDFNFEKYQFRIITCEHNFGPNREKIFNLLTSNGYKRKFEDISKFEDWYVIDINLI